MHPQLGARQKVVVQQMVFMSVAIDDDVHSAFGVNRPELFFIAGRIDNSAHIVVDQHAVALGVLAAANKTNLPFFEIEHGYPL